MVTTYTANERKALIDYGYEMAAKEKRARTAATKQQWHHEMITAWRMAGFNPKAIGLV